MNNSYNFVSSCNKYAALSLFCADVCKDFSKPDSTHKNPLNDYSKNDDQNRSRDNRNQGSKDEHGSQDRSRNGDRNETEKGSRDHSRDHDSQNRRDKDNSTKDANLVGKKPVTDEQESPHSTSKNKGHTY